MVTTPCGTALKLDSWNTSSKRRATVGTFHIGRMTRFWLRATLRHCDGVRLIPNQTPHESVLKSLRTYAFVCSKRRRAWRSGATSPSSPETCSPDWMSLPAVQSKRWRRPPSRLRKRTPFLRRSVPEAGTTARVPASIWKSSRCRTWRQGPFALTDVQGHAGFTDRSGRTKWHDPADRWFFATRPVHDLSEYRPPETASGSRFNHVSRDREETNVLTSLEISKFHFFERFNDPLQH